MFDWHSLRLHLDLVRVPGDFHGNRNWRVKTTRVRKVSSLRRGLRRFLVPCPWGEKPSLTGRTSLKSRYVRFGNCVCFVYFSEELYIWIGSELRRFCNLFYSRAFQELPSPPFAVSKVGITGIYRRSFSELRNSVTSFESLDLDLSILLSFQT